MSDEAAFLAALKANPADDLTRLVFADWLDDRDEPAKSQYLRAVVDLTRTSGGTAEYTDAAERLFTACLQTEGVWRVAAGSRFDVVLERYDPRDKIYVIKILRERTGFGLAEAKALSESVPTHVHSWLRFESAFEHLLAFDSSTFSNPRSISATLRPTAWPNESPPGAVFDIVLAAIDLAPVGPSGYRPLPTHVAGRAALGLSHLLGVSPDEARERLAALPITLATGLAPRDVAEFIRRVKMTLNFYRSLPPDAIRVVPRVPTE
jgi:uncharacterized protein (TIGR02996 family)